MNDSIKRLIQNYKKSFIDSGALLSVVEASKHAINNAIESLKPLMEQIKENTRILAKHSIKLGFYPSNSFNLYEMEFIGLKNEKEEVKYICNKIKTIITYKYIKEISVFFNKSKINDIYDDYYNKKYDDAILKMIVLINTIFNERLESTNCDEILEVKRKFNNIVTGIELPKGKGKKKNNVELNKIKKIHKEQGFEKYAYYIFAPYYYSTKMENALFCNYFNKGYSDQELKEKYKRIPYNRNAIIHGYIDFFEFGNEENCLRWFSVLINTYELFKLLEELSISE